MDTLSHVKTEVDENNIITQLPIRVCMCVREVFRNDWRVRRSATALTEEGFDVSVLDVERESTRSIEEDICGIHVKHIIKPQWYTKTYSLKRLIHSIEKFTYSTLRILKIRADIYHAHDVNTLPVCYIASRLHRKPLIFDAHELPLSEFDRSSNHWLRALLICFVRRMIAGCAGVITVSPSIAQEICTRYHASSVSLVRNTPAYQVVPKSDLLRRFLNLGPQVRIALYQGDIQADRRLDRLVRAAAFLEQHNMIVLMGKGVGETQSELEALAIEEGVTDRVKIIPPVPYEELLHWTASADIGLIVYSPDHSLNVKMCLPNKLFEYLMAGLPVLSTQLDAVADILYKYNAGRIISSLEPTAIGSAINMMLEDRDSLSSMRSNALDATKRDLCWEKERQQLIRHYHDILIKQYVRNNRQMDYRNKDTLHS